MAQQVLVSLIDDLDGQTANETVTFGLDGKSYEIDLSEANSSKLRESSRWHPGVGPKGFGSAWPTRRLDPGLFG
ncbi:hypothetical protein GCM10023321_24040 [Pseudonocardia eucalypti]|uniref:Lsr2 dimerization domain-containing protein n=1 Tax=Pseudonocardia eucalypti TaxID=648755 RepID=A0ABP9PXG5_9PSEU|nr:hypothetical protein [Pseudonocardia eucalypti]